MFRRLVKPTMKRACDWAHDRGVKTWLHSCGDVHPFVPEFIDAGIDCLHPLEVKAGMDPAALKAEYGDRLAFNGGINAAIWGDFDAFADQMREVVPVMKAGGGYIFGSDHSVPNAVSFETFSKTIALAKELGAY
jgi:uroporphyrinogen decarboxylase